MKEKRYVIVNPRRFFTFITVLVALVILLVVSIFTIREAYTEGIKPSVNTVDYWVKEGDTIWDIALERAPKGYDTRRLVYEIRKLNNNKDGMIYIGEKIVLPVIEN